MIYEFALDPELLLKWAESRRDYREYFREYGSGTPRIFSSFPRQKFTKLRSYLLKKLDDSHSIEVKQRYTEMVIELEKALICREIENLTADTDWHSLVKSENDRNPFDAILSSKVVDTERILIQETMYDSTLWDKQDRLSPQRTEESFLQDFGNFILLTSSELVIVDPYCWKEKSINLISNFLNLISRKRVNQLKPKVSVFFSNVGQRRSTTNYVKGKIIEGLVDSLKSIELMVYELEELPDSDVFHNRCIFNEYCGICVPHGFDLSGNVKHTDDVFILSHDQYVKKRNQFIDNLGFNIITQA